MIYVNSAAMQQDIIKLLENSEEKVKFSFKEKKGIKLAFETNTTNLDEAIEIAKAIIKQSDLGKALYFQVTK